MELYHTLVLKSEVLWQLGEQLRIELRSIYVVGDVSQYWDSGFNTESYCLNLINNFT